MNNKKTINLQQQISGSSEYGRIQPQAAEIERAVLGALMIDKDAYAVVCDWLFPESFYDHRHQKIYAAISDMVAKEIPVDVLTVTEHLAQMGELEFIGGPGYMAELTSKVATSANVEYHSHVIAQKYAARQLIVFSNNVEKNAFDETTVIDDLMSEASESLNKICSHNVKKGPIQIDPITKQVYDDIGTAMGNKKEITGIPSGYYNLDRLTLGFQPSDLIVLAGRTSMGKTAFAVSMAKNMVVDYNIPVGFFSLEMSSKQLVGRLISNVCQIDGNKIVNGQMLYDEYDRLEKTVNSLLGVPLYLDDTPAISTTELRIRAKRLVREHGVKIIFIDYLQQMRVTGERYSNDQERVAAISSALKALAKDLNIPIVALSQLNRGVEHREGIEGKRPQLSDLRSSGTIEQDADLVILMFRPEYYHIYQDDKGNDLHNMAEAIVPKNRKGKTGTARLVFRGEYTRFENVEDNSIKGFPIDDYVHV